MDGGCGTYGEEERRVQGLVEKPDGKRPLVRIRRTREDNMKMYIQGTGCGGVDRAYLAQTRDKWWVLP